jgi:hypothetical protein
MCACDWLDTLWLLLRRRTPISHSCTAMVASLRTHPDASAVKTRTWSRERLRIEHDIVMSSNPIDFLGAHTKAEEKMNEIEVSFS